jgi:hypothetical protein
LQLLGTQKGVPRIRLGDDEHDEDEEAQDDLDEDADELLGVPALDGDLDAIIQGAGEQPMSGYPAGKQLLHIHCQ